MSAQPSAPFVLAERRTREIGYARAGEFYWILRLVPATTGEAGDRVEWVSDDFFVYTNPADDFELTPALVRRLKTD